MATGKRCCISTVASWRWEKRREMRNKKQTADMIPREGFAKERTERSKKQIVK